MTTPSEDGLICDVKIPGNPRSKSRPRLGRNGVYTPRASAEWEAEVKQVLALSVRVPERRHAIEVELHFRTPTKQRKDLDNLIKLVLDAANGIVWHDDFQVVSIVASVDRSGGVGETHLIARRGERLRGDCAACGKDLKVRQDTYCSKDCYDISQTRKSPRICVNCGTSFTKTPSKNPAGYCSMACWRLSQGGTGQCRRCGATFEVTPSQPQRWCSGECREADLRSRPLRAKVLGACVECGAPSTSRASNALCRACFSSGRSLRARQGAPARRRTQAVPPDKPARRESASTLDGTREDR